MGPRRNDPCPCGSGRKYKRCCLLRDERERELRDRLEAFALSPPFRAEADRAAEDFFGDRAIDEDDRGTVSAFAGYLLLHHRTSQGDTLLDRFLASKGSRLSDEDRRILSDLRDGRWGAYEVTEVRPGQGLVLRDLLTEDVFDVRDVSASRQLLRWEIVYARLIRGRGAWVGDGALVPFEPELRDDVLRCLEELGARRGDPAAPAILSARCAAAFWAIRALAERPRYDRIVTLEGDSVADCRALYRPSDPRALLRALQARGDLIPAGPDDDGQLIFNWAVPEASLPKTSPRERGRALAIMTYLMSASTPHRRGTARERRVNLADLSLGPEGLEIRCLSEVRLRKTRAWVEGLGVDLEFAGEVVEPFDLREDEGKRRAPVRRAAAADRETRIEEAMRRELAREFLAGWPDAPLPALGGRSPKQAAVSQAHRDALIQLLRGMDYRANRSIGVLRPSDVQGLARLLGLPEDLARAGRPEAAGGSPRRARRGRPAPSRTPGRPPAGRSRP